MDYLAVQQPLEVSFIGCGVQAYFQLMAINESREIIHINLFDVNNSIMAKFVDKTKEWLPKILRLLVMMLLNSVLVLRM